MAERLHGIGPKREARRVTSRNGPEVALWCRGDSFDVGMAPGMTHHVRVTGTELKAYVGDYIVRHDRRWSVVHTNEEARMMLALHVIGMPTTRVAHQCNAVNPRPHPGIMTNRDVLRVGRKLAERGLVVESGSKRSPRYWSLPALPVEETSTDG